MSRLQKRADRVWKILVTAVMDSRGDWKRKVAEASGLSFSRVRALRRLGQGPMTLSALAESLSTDAPAASVAVNDLEKLGLVERKPHPEDRRSKLVSLTAAGKKVLEKARAVSESAPPQIADLEERDLEKLESIFEAFAARS